MWRVAVPVLFKTQRVLDSLSSVFGKEQSSYHIRLSRHGLRFRPFFLSEWFMVLGLWEPYVRRRILLSRGDVFIDVGAHIGYFATLAARRVQEEGVVICVEPDLRNIPILESNTAPYSNVVIVEKACGQMPGRTSFDHGSNPLYSAMSNRGEGAPAVPLTTLDAVTAEILSAHNGHRKYLCKIDVEGGALHVVRGGLSFFKSYRPDIIIEIADDDLSRLMKLLPSYSPERLARNYYWLRPLRAPPTDGVS